MSSRPDVSRQQIEWAIAKWHDSLTPLPHLQQLTDLLRVALTASDIEHFWRTIDWLFDVHTDLTAQAINYARAVGVLRNWDEFHAASTEV